MPTHLMLEAGSGRLPALSPSIFSSADYAWVPHLVLGLFELGAALTTH